MSEESKSEQGDGKGAAWASQLGASGRAGPLFERLYQRMGSRILLVCIGGAAGTLVVAGAVSGIALSGYLKLSSSQTLSWLALWSPINIAASLAALAPSARQLRTILAWSGDRRTAERAAETWQAVVRLPVVVTRCAAGASITITATLVYIVAYFHEPTWTIAPLLLWGLVLGAADWVAVTFTAELALRPMLTEVAAQLPAAFKPRSPRFTLRTKALAPLPSVTAYGMLVVGAITNLSANGPLRLTIALAASLAAIAVASVIFAIVTRSVLDPIEDLVAATKRVAGGDLSRPVPLLSDDELGALAHSFNEMQAGLRERETLHAELRNSAARIATAEDTERRRLQRDLRHGVQRELARAADKLALVDEAIETSAAAAGRRLDELRDDLRLALSKLRDLAHGIYPALLENEGLAAALHEAASHAELEAELECEPRRYPGEFEAAIYFCCREAFDNTSRHAGERASVRVRISERDDLLQFEVSDDGCGYDPSSVASGSGIHNMTDRLGALGGALAISAAPGRGVAVIGTIPLRTTAASAAGGFAQPALEEPPGDYARSPRRLARWYGRMGSRIVLACLAGGTALGLITGLVGAFSLAEYLGLPASQYVLVLAIWVPVVLVLVIVGFARSAPQLELILGWSGDRRTQARAPATWHALIRLPEVLTRGTTLGCLGLAGGIAHVVVRFHEPGWALVPFELSGAILATAIWVVTVFTAELVMRPMLADVARCLPAGFEPEPTGLSFRAKALAPLPVIAIYGTFAVGAFTNASTSGPVRMTIALSVSLVAIALASIVFAIVTRSVLDPIDQLIAATRRVRDGNLSMPVPLMSADELGRLARSFNGMLLGLSERETLHTELRASRTRIVGATDAERRRLERDLHDGAQQQLVVLGLEASLARRLLEQDPAATRSMISELRQGFERALGELSSLAQGIHPAVLERDGLRGALNAIVERAGIPATLACEGVGRYSPPIEAAVYFSCLEALQNAAKHAGEGTRVRLQLAERDHRLRFEVADNGRGYDPAHAQTSNGLQNMTDRLGALGGTLHVVSTIGAGTTITGSVPVKG